MTHLEALQKVIELQAKKIEELESRLATPPTQTAPDWIVAGQHQDLASIYQRYANKMSQGSR